MAVGEFYRAKTTRRIHLVPADPGSRWRRFAVGPDGHALCGSRTELHACLNPGPGFVRARVTGDQRLDYRAPRARTTTFFLEGISLVRTGHRGPPILATKPTTAEPTAVDPGTARAKRMVMAGAYATAGTARAKRVVMAVSHAMVAARTGWQSPPFQEGGHTAALARRILVPPSGGHMNAPRSAA